MFIVDRKRKTKLFNQIPLVAIFKNKDGDFAQKKLQRNVFYIQDMRNAFKYKFFNLQNP